MNPTATPVRISIPASVAADIGSLKKAVGTVLDKLGCQACCSGHDIFFELERDVFLRDSLREKANVMPVRSVSRKAGSMEVGMGPAVAHDIKQVYAAIDRIAELSGHVACATGCDMFFVNEFNGILSPDLDLDVVQLRVARH